MKLGFLAGLAAGMAMLSVPAMATQLLINGDFSSGASGFSTDYHDFTAENDATGNYWITTNPAIICGCFANLPDHTTGTGNLMVLDGAANANSRFWYETISVVPNSAYTLSFFVANLGSSGPQPDISARVNDSAILDTGLLPDVGGNGAAWSNFTQTFNSGSNASLTLSFVDTANTHAFNDFAFDDVSLTGPAPARDVPEPASWSILAIGVIGAMSARRHWAKRA